MSRPRGRKDKPPPIIRKQNDGVASVPPSGSACCDCRGRYPLHSHHLVIHASVYLTSRSYHSSLHSCTCITHSVALLHLFRFHSSTSLVSIYPLTRAPFAHMSRPRGRTDKSPPIIRMRKDGVTSVPPSGSACCDCRGRQ